MKLNLEFTPQEYRNIASDIYQYAPDCLDGELGDLLYAASDGLRDLAKYLEITPEHKYIYSDRADEIVLQSFTYKDHLFFWNDENQVWYDETEDDESFVDDPDWVESHMEPIEYNRELVLPDGWVMVARSHQSCIARRTSDDELVTWSICPNGNGVCWGHYFPSTPDREIKEVYDTFMDKVEME